MNKNDSIAARIIERRAMLGLSQNALAQQSNVAPAQISRYESGKRKPSPQVIKRIAEALGVPFDWLAYGNTTEFENVKDELEGISYSIDLPPDLADMVHKEAARLGITPAEFANHLLELGSSVFSHKIAIDEKMGKKK
ncbi:helix-turn-helix domain-containing protein [Xenorhabdus stockiae]|uniref:helix-turn-helix domain-containing protein n=1 Tax=Xenorhabdus stockiae TaxID=351614 RepID=UPI00406330F0